MNTGRCSHKQSCWFQQITCEQRRFGVTQLRMSWSFCIMQKEAWGPSEAGKHQEALRYVCSWTKVKIWSCEIREKLNSHSCTVSKPQLNISPNGFVRCNREYMYPCARPFWGLVKSQWLTRICILSVWEPDEESEMLQDIVLDGRHWIVPL